MTHDEFDNLIREPLLRERQSAIDVLKTRGWLLIPDVRVELLTSGRQGVFHGVKLEPNVEADFATYEVLQGRLNWQFVSVAAASARIMEGSRPSVEFERALQQIDRWRDSITRNGYSFLPRLPLTDLQISISYRIIIGQSHQQTPDERCMVQQHRRNDLRIRSFDWLLGKPAHYSTQDIDLLNKAGRAKTPMV